MRRKPSGPFRLRVSAVGTSVTLLLLLSGCGGGGGGGSIAPPPPPPPPPPPTLMITTSSLDDGIVGATYSQSVEASGGTGTRTWSATGLPAGLIISSSTGVISGTPTTAGTMTVTVQAQDSGSPAQTASRELTLRVVNPLVITTSSLPGGSLRVAYSAQLAASGGVAPRMWDEPTSFFSDVSGGGRVGSACEGLTLNFADGIISGLPAQAGTCGPFLVEVEDSTDPSQTDSQAFSIVVAGDVVIVNELLPAGVVGDPYVANLVADGGAPPYSWSATGLPGTLSIDPLTGEISGTPAAADTIVFTARVDDAAADFDEKELSVTVQAAAPGRNDSIADATPLVTGGSLTLTATISPFADPSTSGPDEDFYRLEAPAGVTVTVVIRARRLNPPSGLDSVVEILQADGTRFTDCNEGGDGSTRGAISGTFLNPDGSPVVDSTPDAFDDECINDDLEFGATRDSEIEFRPPGTGTVEFFVRVLDWRGDARPDFRYELTIQGAN